MSDPRGRAWERSAEGDPEARAAWLRGRLRAGELEPQRLALLAFLGDPGAGQALPEVSPGPDWRATPEAFFGALAEFDHEAACRLALWSAEPLLEALSAHARWEERPHQAAAALREWLCETDPGRREAARVATVFAHEDAELAGEGLMDLALGVDLDLSLLAWGASAPARLAAELRREALAGEAREVLSELGAGHAELGRDDPLSEALERLRRWCLEP